MLFPAFYSMIRVLNNNAEPFLATQAGGTITAEDYRSIIPYLKQKIEQFGHVSWYFEFAGSHRWTMGALKEDIGFDIRYGKKVSRMAIVGAGSTEEKITKLLVPLIGGEVRFFTLSEKEKAMDWIKESSRISI